MCSTHDIVYFSQVPRLADPYEDWIYNTLVASLLSSPWNTCQSSMASLAEILQWVQYLDYLSLVMYGMIVLKSGVTKQQELRRKEDLNLDTGARNCVDGTYPERERQPSSGYARYPCCREHCDRTRDRRQSVSCRGVMEGDPEETLRADVYQKIHPPLIRSISRHKIAKWILGFIRELNTTLGCSRLSGWVMQTRDGLATFFLGVTAPWKR